jgi:phosphotransferase system enzyme I (PtsI)
MANIELPQDIDAIRNEVLDGVGLYRTEFLFMNRPDMPDEEEQIDFYLSALKALNGLPLTIRTLDLGADKEVDGGYPGGRLCSNPALGLRAIRLCLKDTTLFQPQLRAILRTSAHGPVRLMIPMLSNSQELSQVLHLIDENKRQLLNEGLDFDPAMPIGGMIEVPAAALSAAYFAHHLDFLSIGTNDLIQYTLAIDRIDDEVNYLYNPLHPAVLRLIGMVLDAGRQVELPVGMCGEMAGDPRYTRLLLAMGLREFSMHPTSLQEVKRVVNMSSVDTLITPVRELLQADEPGRINELLNRINTGLFD